MNLSTRFARILALIVVALCFVACRSNTVEVEAIRPLITNVVDRHDSYIVTDAGLTIAEKDIYLQSSALLRQVLDEASPPKSNDATTDD